ncbi:MAG: HigA family addiction module antidote protein [Acidobacteriia bacterium]|nr:HigA family addiction module antidote protein [Terriglobia bacterium]
MAYERRCAPSWAIHPGEILKEEFLGPMDITGYALAKAIGVTPQRVSDIILRKTGISADLAVMLGKFFRMSPEFWMNLQPAYALNHAEKNLKEKIKKIKPYAKAA